MKMSFRTLVGISATGALVPGYQPLQTQLRPLTNIDYMLHKTVALYVLWCMDFGCACSFH